MWTSLLLSRKSFEEHIKIDLNFNFFLAMDDMAFQFLKKNIYNICIHIYFTHDQSIKTKFKLPKDSPIGDKKELSKDTEGLITKKFGKKSGDLNGILKDK